MRSQQKRTVCPTSGRICQKWGFSNRHILVPVRLEPKCEAGGRLSDVRPGVSSQTGQIEIRRLVYKAPILCPERDVPRHRIVCAAAVHERSLILARSPSKGTAGISSRIKNQRAAATQNVWLQFRKSWQLHDRRTGDLVNVRLHARDASSEVTLRVAIVPVVRFGCEPAVDVVAIPQQESAGVGCLIPNAIAFAILCEKAGAL